MPTISHARLSRRPSLRPDLVSSLLREADLANPETKAIAGSPLAGLERVLVGSSGAAWCLNGGDGPQTRRLDPARAATRWFLRGRTGLEDLLLQLYFGHLSLAEVESVASILWGKVEGASLVREVVPGIIERIEDWLKSPLRQHQPYVFLHSVEFGGRRPGRAAGLQIAAAVGINRLGYRELLSVVAAPVGFEGLWDSLLGAVAARGLRAPRLVVGDAADRAMCAAVERRWAGCAFLTPGSELGQGLLSRIEPSDVRWVDKGVTELLACAKRSDGERIGARLRDRLKKGGYTALSVEFGERLQRHLACLEIPRAHWPRLSGANLVRAELNRVREQVRVLGPIHDERALVLLAAATFRRQGRISWNSKPFLAM